MRFLLQESGHTQAILEKHQQAANYHIAVVDADGGISGRCRNSLRIVF